jgi:carbon-monoxide dehydrogenase small subunit
MTKHHVTATVNGDEVEFLATAREPAGLPARPAGPDRCEGGLRHRRLRRLQRPRSTGVLVCSCLVLGVEAEGRAIETIEGMADGETLHPLQRKFLEHAALQCGICTPGHPRRRQGAAGAKNPDPTETEVRFWLAGNLCRCTGYDKIVRAVMDAAAEMRKG